MRRDLGIVLAGVVLLVLFSIGAVLLEDRHAAFEARGTRVTGVLVAVQHEIRGVLTADVRYRVAGVDRKGSVQLDYTYTEAKPGDPVTVIYDPSAPDEIAVPGIANDPVWAMYVMVVLLLGGLGAFVGGVTRLLRAAFARRRRGRRRR
ncbi:DUF3592 domain-containing protein [Lentzea nigeriaca]|uniref:DUF3592 domain-containing protein n=1 Tax=Lentzea nigeriaca TaxID=1128665 RepID=UPI00195C91EB|nr:DUF3592 domain-containing protein [Lentzea nigeriaca]MBM7864601.1 putative iron-regulated membrane protein [Lentzea nigeriaca]